MPDTTWDGPDHSAPKPAASSSGGSRSGTRRRNSDFRCEKQVRNSGVTDVTFQAGLLHGVVA